eukprot:6211049-Pleurochrysis_carterae.AAC.1
MPPDKQASILCMSRRTPFLPPTHQPLSHASRSAPRLLLVATLVIAIANGAHVLWSEGDTAGAAARGAAASGAREHARDAAVRSHQMVMMLSVAAGVAAALAACWLALLRSGARALVWIGAGGSCALGFVNGLWLFMQAHTTRPTPNLPIPFFSLSTPPHEPPLFSHSV